MTDSLNPHPLYPHPLNTDPLNTNRLYKAYEKHLNIRNDDEFYRIDDWIIRMGFGHDYYIFDGPKDTELLDRLDRAIAEIALVLEIGMLTPTARDALLENTFRGPHAERVRAGLRFPDDSLQDYVDNIGRPASDALDGIKEHSAAIREGVRITRNEIESSDATRKSTSRMNVRGIQLVDVARTVWESETGNAAPARDLNLASPFGNFLADLFEALKIKGKPRAVFRAWSRENDYSVPTSKKKTK